MTLPIFERAVLGAGPVGLIAALQSSKSVSTLLVSRHEHELSRNPATPRIESVPAALVNLLLDFAVDPRRLGVDRLHDTRHAAWAAAEPTASRGRAVAHLDHVLLTAELLAVARRDPALSIRTESQTPVMRNGLWQGESWRARTLVDATGRAMAMSPRRVRAPQPWVARPFWRDARFDADSSGNSRDFRIAALPFGYVYRLGASRTDMVWVVGRGEPLSRSPPRLERTLRSSGASWMLDGFAPLATAYTARSYPASVQWCEHSPCCAIGDAALGRDILSSQGLAAGMSDALYAVAARRADEAVYRHRQRIERAAHLGTLRQVFATCRYRDRPTWRTYADFVSSRLDTVARDAALRLPRTTERAAA